MAALLFLLFPPVFRAMRQLATLLGIIEKLTYAGPSSLSESLLALFRLGFWLLFVVVFIAFICIYLHLLFAFIVCINVCIHSYSSVHLAVFLCLGWELLEVKGPIPRL